MEKSNSMMKIYKLYLTALNYSLIFHRCEFLGSIGGWNAVFNKVREFTEPEGLDALQAAQNLLVPVDEALRKRDLSAALKLARECSQLFNKFIPHVTNKDLQQYLIDGNVRIGHFIDSVEKQGPTLFAVNTFLTAEFKNIGGVLKALLLKVGNLVHNVTSLVGGVVHNVGGLVDGLLHRLGFQKQP